MSESKVSILWKWFSKLILSLIEWENVTRFVSMEFIMFNNELPFQIFWNLKKYIIMLHKKIIWIITFLMHIKQSCPYSL